MKSENNDVISTISVLSGAIVWGLVWYPYRVLQSSGMSGAMETLLTYLLAMLFGSFLLKRVWRERPHFGGWAVLLILSSGWANFGYVLAMLHGEVMRVLLLFYLSPVWTILLTMKGGPGTFAFPIAAIRRFPFVTDDPEPADYQHVEINLAAQGTLIKGARGGNLPAGGIKPQGEVIWLADAAAAGADDHGYGF